MVTSAKAPATHRGNSAIGLLCLFVCLASSLSGCAALYPTLSTPVRGAVTLDKYDPLPPKDILFVAIKSARIPKKTRDGRNWDQMGGAAPDVYAVLFVDDKEVLRTAVVSNSLEPKWSNPEWVNLKIPGTAKVRVEMWDDNALVSHPICTEPVYHLEEVVDVGETEVNCESGATVTLVVEPPKARLGIGLYYTVRGEEAYVSRVIAASAAGRAGLKADDRIVSADGRAVQHLQSGELEGIFNGKSKAGIELEVQTDGREKRKVTLVDEPMYPVKGEGIELLPTKTAE